MPIQPGWVKIVLHGNLPQGEIWETGFWMINTGVNSNSLADALCNIIAGTLNSTDDSGAMRITFNALANALTTWTQVRAYVYNDTSGKAAFQGLYNLSPIRAGSGTSFMPLQVAAVITLRTGHAGRRFRGRMYLPATGINISNDGQLLQTDLDHIARGWALAFNDIDVSSTGQIVVASAAGSVATQVSVVTMDSRLDIQRRRANKQTILRSSVQPVQP